MVGMVDLKTLALEANLPQEARNAYRKLAADIARDSIVTKALARFVEQTVSEIHESSVTPLEKRVTELEGALRSVRADLCRTQPLPKFSEVGSAIRQIDAILTKPNP